MRTRIKKAATLIALACLLVAAPPAKVAGADPAPATERSPSPLSAEVETLVKMLPDYVTAAFDESGLPSLSIALVHGRDIVYSQALGYADLKTQTPVTTRTVYPIASITKTFTATMLVMLAEEGVLTLDTPVVKYLPEFQVKSSFEGTRPTTLRQLAVHTSGLPRDANLNFRSDYAALNWVLSGGAAEMKWYASTKDVLASLPHTTLEYRPNSRYSYSNLGYTLLGIALERAAKQSFTEFVEARILTPLGMDDSGFMPKVGEASPLPSGYVYTEPGSEPMAAPEWELGSALYSGGLYSTVEDMARFISLQFQTGKPGGAQIISADGLGMMHLESLAWGYVWDPTYKGIEHSGSHLGFDAYVRAYPGLKIGVVALTNSSYPMADQSPSVEIAQAVLDELKSVMIAEAPFDPAGVNLGRYAGTYSLAGTDAGIAIELRDGALHATVLPDSAFNYPINPVAPSEFGVAGQPDPWLFFAEDDTGTVHRLRFMDFTFEKTIR